MTALNCFEIKLSRTALNLTLQEAADDIGWCSKLTWAKYESGAVIAPSEISKRLYLLLELKESITAKVNSYYMSQSATIRTSINSNVTLQLNINSDMGVSIKKVKFYEHLYLFQLDYPLSPTISWRLHQSVCQSLISNRTITLDVTESFDPDSPIAECVLAETKVLAESLIKN